jgi:hypothetical protein
MKLRSVILSVCEGSQYSERFAKWDVSLSLNMTPFAVFASLRALREKKYY